MSPIALLLTLAATAQAPDPGLLPAARVEVDSGRNEIVIELPPVDLPPHAGHHGDAGLPPVVRAEIPVTGSLYGFRVDLMDEAGRLLPSELLHHFNLIDPDNRELFLPISRRVMAAGKETGGHRLPRFLFGLPVERGDRLVANAMLHNPTATGFRGVRARLVLRYVPGNRFWPLLDGFPFHLDVAFPVGDKSFPLPPGHSSMSYEGHPGVAGKIVAIGGHLHEFGTRLELTEVETGKVIWSAEPLTDENGTVVGVPIGKLFGLFRIGAPVVPGRTYRVTVYYDNPTVDTLDAGGMGVVGGLFVPDRGAVWPAPDKGHPLYIEDARHYMRVDRQAAKTGHQH